MMPTIPRGGAHHLQIHSFGGWDTFLLPLCPRALRLRLIARKILRHHANPTTVSPGSFTFSLPGETAVYEITSPRGSVVPFRSING